ncbi:MAG: hypothetical protein NC099_01145 [Corallococcus sp.]|nr:hypothetical protein [Bacillota bacterium]MCM1533240.1 hypothetical protein [Corallococcus sp.]
MKFPVFKKSQKTTYAVIASIPLVITLAIASILFVDGARRDGAIIIAAIVVIALLMLPLSVLTVIWGFSDVVIDETGIALYFGKIKLNKMKWTDVKRIELIFGGAKFWVFNAMTKDKPSFSFRRVRVWENTNKKRITFAYDDKALELIMQYYDGEIISPQPM